jgi:hypothetical protein
LGAPVWATCAATGNEHTLTIKSAVEKARVFIVSFLWWLLMARDQKRIEYRYQFRYVLGLGREEAHSRSERTQPNERPTIPS